MAARPDVKVIRQWLWARGRQVADLAVRGYRAARREAAKDKYREYLSDAYGRMRTRYPAVENTAREALDAIGVRPADPPRDDHEPAGPVTTKKPPVRKKKTAARKRSAAGGKKAGGPKTTAARKKKAGTKKSGGTKKSDGTKKTTKKNTTA